MYNSCFISNMAYIELVQVEGVIVNIKMIVMFTCQHLPINGAFSLLLNLCTCQKTTLSFNSNMSKKMEYRVKIGGWLGPVLANNIIMT